ncbi:hypothetical protein [Paraburkholderia tropica]|uniref:hypothetical protein n=1 Tax=Paraburkholderia tropica TaxID=92647 RepID=UPI002AB7899E|nr:hypothetical protein [Paraburkholderia tropica]
MFSISASDLLKVLEQLPVWRKVVSMSNEIDALKKRIELLEQTQQQVPKADQCPKCRGLAFRLQETVPDPTFGALGVQRSLYKCSSCGYSKYEQIS